MTGTHINISGERLSVLVGLALTLLSAVPGYYVIRDDERLVLACGGALALIVATVVLWMRMSRESRSMFVSALKALVFWLIFGVTIVTLWQAMTAPMAWYQCLPRGMMVGLLGHVLYGWWRSPRKQHPQP